MDTVSINISRHDALLLAVYLSYVKEGLSVPHETQEDYFEMQNIVDEVISQIDDFSLEG